MSDELTIKDEWAQLAIDMISELRQDYIPGKLSELDGVKAIKRLRAQIALYQRLAAAVQPFLRGFPATVLNDTENYPDEQDAPVIEYCFSTMRDVRELTAALAETESR